MKRLPLLAIALLAACVSSSATGDAESAIRAANELFSRNLRAGNIDAMVDNFYAPDAVVMPPNAPAFRGRDNIKQLFKALAASGQTDVTLTSDNVMQSCDMATEIGHYDVRGTATHEPGKYVVTWKRIDGQWRAVADIFNANAPTH